MNIVINSNVYRVALLMVALFIFPSSQAQSQGQVSIVVPLVSAGKADVEKSQALLMSFVVAQSIRLYFRRPTANIQRSAVVVVPAPLPDEDVSSAMTLAKINGAQITLSLSALQQPDGALIHAALVIPPSYNDFRSKKLEYVRLNYAGKTLILDIPSRYIAFPTTLLNLSQLRQYDQDKYLQICPLESCVTGAQPVADASCLKLGSDIPFTATLRLREISSLAVLSYNSHCYVQQLPFRRPIEAPVIDFVVGVERLFAGDWDEVISRMAAVVNSNLEGTDVALEAYLYMVRASIHLLNYTDAEIYLTAAEAINKNDSRVVDTRVFFDVWALANSVHSPQGAVEAATSLNNHLKDEPNFIRVPAGELLQQLNKNAPTGAKGAINEVLPKELQSPNQ